MLIFCHPSDEDDFYRRGDKDLYPTGSDARYPNGGSRDGRDNATNGIR